MNLELIWIILGKLPVLLCLSIGAYVSAKRVGVLRVIWAFSALFVSLSLGISILPSILGAVGAGVLAFFVLLTHLSPKKQAWKSIVWPLAVSILSIIIIGRVGCWFSACCFGEVTHIPWATHYAHEGFIASYHLDRYGDLAVNGPLPVHPVQLYESLGAFLLLASLSRLKGRIGEPSAASLMGGSYLALYALLNPLRAHLNTPSSLVTWGPLSQLQWLLLALSLVTFYLAMRLKQSHINHPVADEHLELSGKKALSLWFILTLCGASSLDLGTDFSAELSALGMCLSAVALVQSVVGRSHSALSESLWFQPSLPNPYKGALLLLIIPFCLVPLVLAGIATPNGSLSVSSPRAWVYQLEATQQKVVRIGKARQVLKPLTSIEVYDLDSGDLMYSKGSKVSKTSKVSRWLIQGGVASGAVDYEACLSGCETCSGESVYVQQKQQNQLRNASVAYQHTLSNSFIGQIHSSWFHERLKGERTSNEIGVIDYPIGMMDFMHLGLGYDLSNDIVKVGFGLRYRWGSAEGHFEKMTEGVTPDLFLAFGYKYVFIEGGSGIFWGAPTTGGTLLGLRVEAEFFNDFAFLARVGVTSIGPLHEVTSPLIHFTLRVPYVQASYSAGDFNGFNLGFVF